MKKVLALALVIALCATLASCSLINSIWDSLSKAEKNSIPTISGDQHFSTIQEYADFLSQSGQDDETVAYEVFQDGNSLVYEFTFKTQIEPDGVSIAKNVLEESLESNKSTYEAVIDEMEEQVDGVSSPTVVVRYLNHDGTLIAERTYTK